MKRTSVYSQEIARVATTVARFISWLSRRGALASLAELALVLEDHHVRQRQQYAASHNRGTEQEQQQIRRLDALRRNFELLSHRVSTR